MGIDGKRRTGRRKAIENRKLEKKKVKNEIEMRE